MRIAKQSSGGRGEYELADYSSTGETPASLLENGIINLRIKLDSISFDSGIILTNKQGKYRLRRKSNDYSQIQIQIADALLLPHPIRDERRVTGGEPLLKNDNYIIKNIYFRYISLKGKYFEGNVLNIDCANKSIDAFEINVTQRVNQLTRVWDNSRNYPNNISSLLNLHQKMIKSGSPIPKQATKLIRELQKATEDYYLELSDENMLYSKQIDVLPALLNLLDDINIEQPIPLDQIEPENIELKKREIVKWRLYARKRGYSSVLFRKNVRDAYRCTCIICGSKFPKTKANRNPGVDAAHILPWSIYDLDKINNGIALCKTHHWAFDEGLLTISFVKGKYFVELTDKAKENLPVTEFSIDQLESFVGEISEDRLPNDRLNRPHPKLLQRLKDESL